MMNGYYEFVNALPKGTNINRIGWVAGDLMPFENSHTAYDYAMKTWSTEPRGALARLDPSKCRELAARHFPEVEYLLDKVDGMIEETGEKIKHLAEQRDAMNDNDVFESAHKEVIQANIEQEIGRSIALHDVWKLLHDRKFELWRCIRAKEDV